MSSKNYDFEILIFSKALNYFCQKEVIKRGCDSFNFRAPLTLSKKFTGKYEVTEHYLNNAPVFKKTDGNAYVFVNLVGNWIFSDDKNAEIGSIWLQKTVDCPAHEKGNGKSQESIKIF